MKCDALDALRSVAVFVDDTTRSSIPDATIEAIAAAQPVAIRGDVTPRIRTI
jgi:hypothetical protein